ncbi:MAG: hypothetical protein AAF674_02535 [Pseudomonadota bacterium]
MTDEMNLAVLGNSHLAAAHLGWQAISDEHQEVRATFFGAPWDMMKDLSLDGARLVPRTGRLRKRLEKTSGGQAFVDVPVFDAFVLYGLQFGVARLLQVYRTYRPMSFEWSDTLEDLAPMRRVTAPVQRISERLFDRTVLAALGDSLALRLAGMLRQVTDAPVLVVSEPGFSERVLDCGDWDGILGSEDSARLATRFRKLSHRACPEGVQLLFPRDSLTAHGMFTNRTFASDETEEGKIDSTHTGALYGAEMMRHAISAIRRDNAVDDGRNGDPQTLLA